VIILKEKVVHYLDVEAEEVKVEGAKNTRIRWLISDKDGAPNFAMRMFEVDINGCTPLHNHPWEHEIFILNGEAKVKIGDKEYMVKSGYALFIPPNIEHTIINIGNSTLRFLCFIPIKK